MGKLLDTKDSVFKDFEYGIRVLERGVLRLDNGIVHCSRERPSYAGQEEEEESESNDQNSEKSPSEDVFAIEVI